jgi:hypothetical protein
MQIWSQASQMAARTPQDRNRYVDFLRSVSILVVIIGHWLIATAWVVDGEMAVGHLIKDQPQMQWLTWIFQVMPIFFIVGGYSNAVSLESAKRKGVGYADWLFTRLNRLVGPLLLLVIAWAVIAVMLVFFGARPEVVRYVSQASLIPTWFLAIYIMVVILAPATYAFWKRFGFASFWIFAAAAALTDVAFFAADVRWLGWSNYFWVWLAVHHLGFAWRDGRMGSAKLLLFYAGLGFLALWALINYGPYPLAMVGSPDPGVSNSQPPKLTLLALGVFQFGLLLSLEKPMRRVLNGLRLWTATVLINSMIMTVFLWHITVMVVFVALLYLADGLGLGLEPGTADWWLSRPIFIAILFVLLLPVALLLSPLERRAGSADSTVPMAARQVVGAMMLCLGVALLAKFGYDGSPTSRIDLAAFALVIIGAGVSGLLPRLK